MANKIKVGWFSFTCCEDSTIIFTELLNQHYQDWLAKIEFVHARIFKKEEDEIQSMDIAFVEGAISSNEQEKKLKEIRKKAKILVAIGSCAVFGSPANQRNFFNQRQIDEIKPILEKFSYKEKVLKVSDLVKVDEVVIGCPMDERIFLQVLNKYLNASN